MSNTSSIILQYDDEHLSEAIQNIVVKTKRLTLLLCCGLVENTIKFNYFGGGRILARVQGIVKDTVFYTCEFLGCGDFLTTNYDFINYVSKVQNQLGVYLKIDNIYVEKNSERVIFDLYVQKDIDPDALDVLLRLNPIFNGEL